jgi:DNA-binding Xre family transcriptional regulator
MELGGDSAANGLAQLVLTLVKLLHDLLEKQAIRRMEAGRLSDEQVEKVGQTLKRQAETIEQLCEAFDLEPGDLDLSLGSVQGIDATDLGRTDQDR